MPVIAVQATPKTVPETSATGTNVHRARVLSRYRPGHFTRYGLLIGADYCAGFGIVARATRDPAGIDFKYRLLKYR